MAQLRLDDAVLLLSGGRHSSAYYLAGYCVELALKACIAKEFQANAIPDKGLVEKIYKHDLGHLLNVAGLKAHMDRDSNANGRLATNWSLALGWSEASRYSIWDELQATSLVQAVGDPNHGVLQWVKMYW